MNFSALLPVLGAAIITTACAALAIARQRTIRSGPSPALGALLTRLRRTAPANRLELAREGSDEGTWEGRLVRAVADAASSFDAGDVVSEAVSDLAGSYSSRERWSSAALRIQVLGGVLMGAAGLIAGEHLAAAAAVGVAFVGAGLLAALGRRAEAEEKERRRQVDELVELLLDRPREPAARPARWGKTPSPLRRGGRG